MNFELVIKNGKIVDGSGSQWFRAGVSMNGRVIKEGKKVNTGRLAGKVLRR